jgi:hypothetical protein
VQGAAVLVATGIQEDGQQSFSAAIWYSNLTRDIKAILNAPDMHYALEALKKKGTEVQVDCTEACGGHGDRRN